MSTPFLLGIDLEDVRDLVPGGLAYPARVPAMTERLLDLLGDARATFFVTGDVARRYPALVRRIAAEGHEIACHSDKHVALDRLDPDTFRADTRACLEALEAAGVPRPRGYRAPYFSLTERTRWAYPVLGELGFTWSSSVLPARNPLHGWAGFGTAPRRMDGIMELPVTLLSPRLPVPAGGVYLRALPGPMVTRALKRHARVGTAVVSYVHAHDIDDGQDRFAHPGFARYGLYNWLMYRNRHVMLPRLAAACRRDFRIARYGAHVEALAQGLADD